MCAMIKKMLHTVYRLDKPVKVHLPDGSSRQVMVAGKVRLTKEIILTDVLYVPGFTNNLMSAAQLIQGSGIRCIFYPTHCIFQNTHDNRTIAAGRMERNLYIFETTVENHFLHLFRTEDMTLERWHQFLGHPSISTMRHMNQLSGMFRQQAVEAVEQCEICMRAKLTRDPFLSCVQENKSII